MAAFVNIPNGLMLEFAVVGDRNSFFTHKTFFGNQMHYSQAPAADLKHDAVAAAAFTSAKFFYFRSFLTARYLSTD